MSRRPPAPSARAWPRRWGWRWPASGWPAATTATAFTLFDFDVYALAGDGCMMEGIASEAASFAGHQRLSNLCWIYDSNRVTIEGHTDITFTEDVAARFVAYGWNIAEVADANDLDEVGRAFHSARAEQERPTLVLVHSHIGYGSPVEDTPKAHGEPFGAGGGAGRRSASSASRRTRTSWCPRTSTAPSPTGSGHRGRGRPGGLGGPVRRLPRRPTPIWPTSWTGCSAGSCPTAGRRRCRPSQPTPPGWPDGTSSGRVLNALAEPIPWLMGGSADLSPSTKTNLTLRGRRARSSPAAAAAGTSTSASGSTRRPPSPTGWRSRRCGPTGRASSSSPTTPAAPSGCRR